MHVSNFLYVEPGSEIKKELGQLQSLKLEGAGLPQDGAFKESLDAVELHITDLTSLWSRHAAGSAHDGTCIH